MPDPRPLVLAANRLPIARTEDGWAMSPGGLVRALLPMLQESGGSWVGWTGEPDSSTEIIHHEGVDLYPIPISQQELELYYEGFSNDTLWPLYHDAIRDSGYHSDEWDAYFAVNDRFAVAIANIAPQGAMVWVHDYQLQLVPKMLRNLRPDLRIGWFDHIPFPPPELFQRLPWRNEIIDGLLGADVLGFQRTRGAANLMAAAQQFVGAESIGDNELSYEGRTITVGAYPISIDFEEFANLAAGRTTRKEAAQIRARLGDPEVVLLGVDRLDYTKGIGPRLQSFGRLLDSGRLDPGRHVMVQVATPTREGVEMYQEERREIERIVGEINGRHSRIGFPVIHYIYQTLPLDTLIPLYRTGDVMLVTPFRDGMNLVAKEYVAAHFDNDGVLVLSEFTGAADELTDAVLVNPHDEHSLDDAIATAVEMHRHERIPRMENMRKLVATNDVSEWARRFLRDLAGVGE